MLNLLSNYIGLENWNAFKAKNSFKTEEDSRKNNYKIALVICTILIGCFYFFYPTKHKFEFCFVDTIKNEAITKIQLDIKVLSKNESPLYFKTDDFGCFNFESEYDHIKFVVQSPYHMGIWGDWG